MFEESAQLAIIQLSRIKHLELLMKLQDREVMITEKIDANLNQIISIEAAYYFDDYAVETLKRLLEAHRKGTDV
jgi:hypothetical protein